MTDRELLDLAAKAVEIDLCWNDAGAPGYYMDFRGTPQWAYWNPLVFDGPALRLAVRLRFRVNVKLDGVSIDRGPDEPLAWERIGIVSDENRSESATRRAIVRAAAEIGRKML